MKDLELINRVKQLMERDADNPNSFARKVDIDPANFRRKLSGERSITRKDILKMCKTLGVSREWLEEGKGNIYVKEAYSVGGDINIGSSVEKAVRDAMNAPAESACSKVSNMLSAGDVEVLRRENALLREQIAKKDEQIKQLMDLLAKK